MGQTPSGGAQPAVLSAGTGAFLLPCSELGQHVWISLGYGKSSPESSPGKHLPCTSQPGKYNAQC